MKTGEWGLLSDSTDIMYGTCYSDAFIAWLRNIWNKDAHSAMWAQDVRGAVMSYNYESQQGPEQGPKYWTVTANFDYSPMGDASLGVLFRHSFVSIAVKGKSPSLVFDPWSTCMPEVYSARSYFAYHEKNFVYGVDFE